MQTTNTITSLITSPTIIASLIIALALFFSGRYTFITLHHDGVMVRTDRVTGDYEVIYAGMEIPSAINRAAIEYNQKWGSDDQGLSSSPK